MEVQSKNVIYHLVAWLYYSFRNGLYIVLFVLWVDKKGYLLEIAGIIVAVGRWRLSNRPSHIWLHVLSLLIWV